MSEGVRAFLKQMEQAIVNNMVDMGRNQSMIDAEAGGEESTAFSIRLIGDVWLGIDFGCVDGIIKRFAMGQIRKCDMSLKW